MKCRFLLIVFFISLANFLHAQTNSNGSYTKKHIRFSPNSFSNSFSFNIKPVLYIDPGDTVVTETIDAMGQDKNGIKRQKGGNPLTGPFYINNARVGDILKITLTKVLLNRNYAYTTEAFVSRSLPDSITDQFKKPHLVKWKFDVQHSFAIIDSPFNTYTNLTTFQVPLHPFVGCIGVAPANKKNEILSFFQGNFGGNLDFSNIKEGSTIYLPVLHDGAYLYVGDGHALQGDGEIAGNALETSLDVEFTTEILKQSNLKIYAPLVEDPGYIMATGIAKSIDEATKIATNNLLDWLQANYNLTLQETTQVMSTSIEYKIAEIADPEVIIVAEIRKTILQMVH